MSYIGNSPNLGALSSQILSGDGSTAFTLSYPSGSAASLGVYISGVHQVPTTDYSVAVSTITFVVAPPTGTNNISIVFYGLPATIGVPGDGTVTDAKIIAMDATKLTGTIASARLSNVDLTTLSASNLTSGTVADARFPAVLPAISGANLTSLPSDITKQSSDPTVSTNPAGGVGSIILNTTTGKMFVLTDATAGANVWQAGVDGTVQPPTAATGGTITTDGDYKVHTFTSSGTFSVSAAGQPVEYLVVAGGGGGAMNFFGGGGGAGGYRTATGFSVTATAYSITVGAGGATGAAVQNANAGNDSVFSTITSIGGGYGSGYSSGDAGGDGGSGGGGTYETVSSRPGGSGTVGQGNDGGDSVSISTGAGGGGAGAVGETTSTSVGGAGGDGLSSSITGSAVFRAGGGAGGSKHTESTTGAGGNGGGGSGASTTTDAVVGTANSGGGGGGGCHTAYGGHDDGKAGGSGVVIIRYQFQ